MKSLSNDEAMEAVWIAMAYHFLDTETRHEIPETAYACINAGLSVAQAGEIWRYEVSPTVAFNAWSYIGEWAGWCDEWLIESIKLRRAKHRRGLLAWLRYRVSVHVMHCFWISIQRCMTELWHEPDQAHRDLLFLDLSLLARHFFDFCPPDAGRMTATDIERLTELYPRRFMHIMKPVVVWNESTAANARVQALLHSALPSAHDG